MGMKQSEGHLINFLFYSIRLSWFILWMFLFISIDIFHQLSVPFWLLIVWLSVAYLVPQLLLVFVPKSRLPYYQSELLLTWSLYTYLLLIAKTDSSLLLIPLIGLGLYFTYNKKTWWIVCSIILLTPIFGLVLGESYTVMLTHLLNNSIALGVGYAFHFMGVLLRENQRQYSLIHDQKIILEQYADKVEYLTLLEERNRMARELHDTAGHTFTSVIVGIDGVIANLKRSDQERALKKLQLLRNVTSKGLDEIRANIHSVVDQENKESLNRKLTSLANEFGVHTGTSIHYQQTGEEHELSSHVQHTFLRCLQEALTNSKRHGNAQNVYISLDYGTDLTILTIRDDGRGNDQIQLGFGINSMKQRLQSLHGTLHISTTKNVGMVVSCSIPN
ncbi:signal transduction histidine kinase [Salirhabdus euzebyi]|uniref:histidine kinase n=1 Tax=Salirhabdus euzebyi TaxID=394506 RepID=A0A841Q9B5_9BACI|nr:sensor histidine kinase [Salirhabdus euzebyi]MBB6454965.1 signal transduction histidine kinase [Salirhabdus euzebyi]